MTKRVKLLSVMVAAVLCFTAGLAILFGSNNTASADAAYTKQNVTFVNSGSFYNAEAPAEGATTVTFEWKNNGKTVFSAGGGYNGIQMFNTSDPAKSDADATNYTHNLDANHWWQWNGVGAGVTADAIFKNTSYESFKLVFAVGADTTANREEAFQMYGVNGETETQLRYAGTAPAATWGGGVVDGAIYYGVRSRISSGVTISVDDLMCYDSTGKDLGVKVTNEVAPEVDASAIAGKSYGATSSFWVASATATTSRWLFLEWDNDEGNTTVRTGGGWTYGVALGDATLNSVTATTDNIWHDFGGDYFGATSAGKHVKVAVNTATGEITTYIDGAVHGSSTRPVEGLSAVKFRAGVNSNYTCNSLIHNFKAYDAEGNDLGVETNMAEQTAEIVSLNSINTSSVSAYDYAVPGTANLFNATATESDWIIFEWTNDAENSVVAGGGHMFSYGLGATQQNTELVSVTDRTQLLMKPGTIRVAFETATGKIYRAFNSDVWTACPEGTVNKAGASGPLFAGILWNNGNVTKGKVYGLKCYDENGNDLGIAGNFVRVYEGRVVDILGNLGANEVGGGRYIGHIKFKDTEGNDIPGFCLGSFPAKKYGTEEVTLNFSPVDGSHQLFSPASNGKTGTVGNGWEWSDYNNEWYVVEAGTVFANAITLVEDMIIRIHGSSMQLFNASTEFAITYAGVDGAENTNPATRTFLEAVELAPATAEGKIFSGWYVGGAHDVNNIAAGTFGDVTVTGLWKSDSYIKNYALSIGADLSVTVKAELIGYSSTKAVFTTADGTIVQEVAQVHTGWGPIPNASWEFAYTFTGVLPQHLGDDINVKIYNGEDLVLETDINVADYLDAKVAEDGADAALAQDVLYYGAAAQLYTNHDVENVVADLSAAAPVEIPADASVYAKAGEKDANYYWYDAKVVYDNTVKLVLTIVAPADSAITVAFGADEIAATVNEAGLYEVAFAVPAHAFGTSADLTIKVDGEAVGQVLTYSVNSYIVNAPATDADYATLLERLYCLGVSAAAYANA